MKRFNRYSYYNEENHTMISLDGKRFYYNLNHNNSLVRPLICTGVSLRHRDGILSLTYNFFSDGKRQYDLESEVDIRLLG